ncbi:hypothetical protein LZ31DRAFT_540507 [Colletotrichum somersetense]|nr:hypothetical protein LZ31DRAFT_540507 [Colletotrichum somersetense]
MHMPSFCKAATVGMAFYAMTAVAAPMSEPGDSVSDAAGIRIPGTAPNVDNIQNMSNAALKRDDKDGDKNNGITQDRNRRCRRDIDGKRRDCDYDYYGDDDYGRRGRGRGRGRGGRDGDYDDRGVQNGPNQDGKDLGKRGGDDDGYGHHGGYHDGYHGDYHGDYHDGYYGTYGRRRGGGEDGGKGPDDGGRDGPRRQEEHS